MKQLPKTKNEKDREIWTAIRRGDETAIVTLFENYYESLFKFGLKLSLDRALTKDCIQEIFANLWERRDQLEEVIYVKAYLSQALKFLILKKLRKLSKEKKQDSFSDLQLDIIFSYEEKIIAEQNAAEQSRKIKKALNLLSTRQSEIIQLRFFEGLDYEEIMRITNLSYKSLRNIVYESLKILRKHMHLFLLFFPLM